MPSNAPGIPPMLIKTRRRCPARTRIQRRRRGGVQMVGGRCARHTSDLARRRVWRQVRHDNGQQALFTIYNVIQYNNMNYHVHAPSSRTPTRFDVFNVIVRYRQRRVQLCLVNALKVRGSKRGHVRVRSLLLLIPYFIHSYLCVSNDPPYVRSHRHGGGRRSIINPKTLRIYLISIVLTIR